ncbi:T9SS type A sorting domain-containing protein [Rapidithrix thailandica]|uniref:T9SS type A sorting domain-containing protein n=1 Tax=Rapidithrix thailandica TaxID=413964 RepID=A0AAW9S333_9BACT
MKKHYFLLLFLILFLFNNALAQVWIEDFSGYSTGATTGNDDNLPLGSDWSALPNGSPDVWGVTLIGNDKFYASNTGSEQIWASENIDISGEAYVQISLDVFWDFGAGDYIQVIIQEDGGKESTIFEYISTAVSTGSSVVTSRILTGNNVQITIKINGQEATFDNVTVSSVVPIYSFNTGNWSDGNNWSTDDFSVGGRVACGCTPNGTNVAVIGNNDVITLDVSGAVGAVDVQNTGTLQWGAAYYLDIEKGFVNIESGGTMDANSNTADINYQSAYSILLNNEGTLEISNISLNEGSSFLEVDGNSSITLSEDLLFSSGSANSTITNNLSDTLFINRLYFDENNTGFVNNQTTSINSAIYMDGSSISGATLENNSVLIFQDITLNDGDLELNNNATIYQSGDFTDGSIDSGSEFSNLNGATWNFAGTGTSDADVESILDCATNSNTFNYNAAGGQTVFGLNYYHVQFAESGTKVTRNDLDVDGNLIITGNATLDADHNISIAGDWQNNLLESNFDEGTNTVTFDGTTDQNITLSDTEEIFYNFTINKASGDVIPNAITQIKSGGKATFTQGIVQTTSSTVFQFESGSTSNGGASTSYVDGPVKKTGSEDFYFPIGDNGVWARASITNMLTADATTEFTAEYHYASYSDDTIDPLLLVTAPSTIVSTIEYWDVEHSGGTAPGLTEVSLAWEDARRSDITQALLGTDDLQVAHYDEGSNHWEINNPSASLDFTDINSPGSATSSFSSFSPFTFISTSGNNPLPVVLSDFFVTLEENGALLQWETLSETNNSYFEIQRSLGGDTFQAIGYKDAIGRSNSTYQFMDHEVYNLGQNNVYYRLKQVDTDKKESFSKVISVKLPNRESILITLVSPNPFHSDLKIVIETNTQKTGSIQLIDITGNRLYHSMVNLTKGINEFMIQHLERLPSGMYFVLVKSPDKQWSEKVVKK